jgi:hypothetical protein
VLTGERAADLPAVPLARLTTKRLEAFYRALSEAGLSPRTVRLVHSVLHAALKTAVRDRLLVSNPASGAELPRQARREMHALDRAGLARLLAASEATENRWHALWTVLATGGLRPSEALRLRWADVGADHVTVRGETKTAGSRRTVTLPAATMDALKWHRTRQEAEKIAAGAAYRDRGLVFANEIGGALAREHIAGEQLAVALKRLRPDPGAAGEPRGEERAQRLGRGFDERAPVERVLLFALPPLRGLAGIEGLERVVLPAARGIAATEQPHEIAGLAARGLALLNNGDGSNKGTAPANRATRG